LNYFITKTFFNLDKNTYRQKGLRSAWHFFLICKQAVDLRQTTIYMEPQTFSNSNLQLIFNGAVEVLPNTVYIRKYSVWQPHWKLATVQVLWSLRLCVLL